MYLKKMKVVQYLNALRALGYSYHEPIFFRQSKVETTSSNSLEQLQTLAMDCSLCELSKSRKNIVFGRGNIHSKIMFVGDAPNILEDEASLFLVGNTGELLEKIINNVLGADFGDFYYTNIVKCKTPNNRLPLPDEVLYCKSYLEQQISILKPRLIIALGATSFKYLTGSEDSFEKMRGQIVAYSKATSLIATFHPSFLLRNPSSKKEAFEDFKCIKSFLETIENTN